MIIHIMFDAYASAYEINSEIHYLKSKPGIKSVRLLSKKEGEAPKFCLEITAEDDAAEIVQAEIDRTTSRYASEISNVKLVTYTVA